MKIFPSSFLMLVLSEISRTFSRLFSSSLQKGFGFVEFASQAEQQAALALDGTKQGDRPLSVKVWCAVGTRSLLSRRDAYCGGNNNRWRKMRRAQMKGLRNALVGYVF
jgi:hypothetical protein